MKQFTASTVLCFCTCLALAGAWDVGPFDNDDALDWVWELSESNDLSVVEEALHEANNSPGYLEAPTGSIAIAAAEVVAALRGKPRKELPEDVSAWVRDHEREAGDSLVQPARQAVARVRNAETSELAQLWSGSDEILEQWHSELADLEARLQ